MTDLKSHPGDAAFITISTGVAATETCGGELRALWACADAALYAAKRAGRNRVSAGTVGAAAAAATAAAVGTAAAGTVAVGPAVAVGNRRRRRRSGRRGARRQPRPTLEARCRCDRLTNLRRAAPGHVGGGVPAEPAAQVSQ